MVAPENIFHSGSQGGGLQLGWWPVLFQNMCQPPKKVYFSNGTRASFSLLPGIPGKEKEPQECGQSPPLSDSPLHLLGQE